MFFSKDIIDFDVGENVNIELDEFLNVDVEQVVTSDCANSISSVVGPSTNENVYLNIPKMKQNKRKNIDEEDSQGKSNNDADLKFWSPPSCRLRSRKRSDDINGVKIVSKLRKNDDGKK